MNAKPPNWKGRVRTELRLAIIRRLSRREGPSSIRGTEADLKINACASLPMIERKKNSKAIVAETNAAASIANYKRADTGGVRSTTGAAEVELACTRRPEAQKHSAVAVLLFGACVGVW